MVDDRSHAFVFVCQAGALELQALVLALSLQRFASGDHELIAAVPTPSDRWGIPRPETLDRLEALGARIAEIENPIDGDYPIGNKLSCLDVPTTKDMLVFLDSDVICLSQLTGDEFPAPFNAKPADLATFGLDDEMWKHVYAALGLELPVDRVTTTVGGDSMLPYFNAGVVAVSSDVGFGAAWIECCRRIDADPAVSPKRPWLDQIGLPVAARLLGLEIGLLTEELNYPAHLRRVDDENPPVFCHYHDPKNLLRSRHAVSVLRQLGVEHPFVWDLMREEASWKRIAKLGSPSLRRRVMAIPGAPKARLLVRTAEDRWHARRTTPEEMSRNAIITGFPRSGTSLYSTLLNTIPNVVCLNEISDADTFRFYHRTRRRIAAGLPVPNKFSAEGGLTTDTIAHGTRTESRVVEVVDDGFVLAQKFTLPYLNRLEELCDDGFSVWVLVRHPLDSISSWKRSPANFGIAQIDPPGPLLAHIDVTGSTPDERRVDIWNHYAREIDRLRDRLEIVRYEDLVAAPERELDRFREHFGLGPPEVLPAVTPRTRRDAHPTELSELVSERCELGLFGYT